MKPVITRTLLLFATPIFAAAPPAPRILVDRDLAYGEPERQMRALDVYAYRAVEGKGLPVIFWIHGGGWQGGDKTEMATKPQAFVEQGYVFVSVNYRLLPVVTIKQMGADVAKAISWVHANIRKHGGDPNSIFVMGHSAGAQLAALVCTDDRYLKAEGLSLNIVKGCVPVDGDTYDVAKQIEFVGPERGSAYARKFGDAESQKDLSAVMHAAKGKSIPPFLILHIAPTPTADGRYESGTRLQALILAKALQQANVSVKIFQGEGKTHRTLDTDLGLPADPPTQALFEFIKQQLARAG